MRHLNFENDAELIKLEFPIDWAPDDLTGLTLTIQDHDDNELLAADAVTLYSVAALDADSLRYSREITLETGDDELAVGDLIRINGILGLEDHVVKGWDSANLTAELEDHVDRDFEAGATVYRLSATAEVDLSDTDVYPAGQELLLIWTPTGTGGPITREAVISAYRQVDIAGLINELMDVYPRAYKALTTPRNRLERIAARARSDIRKKLLVMDSEFEINNVRDQDLLLPVVAAQCAVLWTLNGDDDGPRDLTDEREVYNGQVATEIDTLSKLNIWVDTDADLVDDPLEKREHPHIFFKGW